MSPRVSKSKNLDKYPYFLLYDSPTDIPFDRLAEQLGVHPNLLRGMIRSARSNGTIYTALRKKGYGDHQIPAWFARPDEPLVYRRAAPAGPQVSAEKRSGAEDRSEPKIEYSQPTIDVVQEGSAERFSALSVHSALPAKMYRLVQPIYQPPMNPIIEEALGQIREIQDEELRASLDRLKRRRDPPKPVSLDVIKARVEAHSIMHQIEARNTFQTMWAMNMFQPGKASEPIDIEELKENFTRPFEEMSLKKERERLEWKETIDAVGSLFECLMPNTGPSDDFMRMYEAAVRRRRKSDGEAWESLAMLVAEKRKWKNFDLVMIEHQGRQIIENFYKDINRMLE